MGRTVVNRFTWLVLPFFALIAGPAPAQEKFRTFASVGTGALNGIYYPVGGAICSIGQRPSPRERSSVLAGDDAGFGL